MFNMNGGLNDKSKLIETTNKSPSGIIIIETIVGDASSNLPTPKTEIPTWLNKAFESVNATINASNIAHTTRINILI